MSGAVRLAGATLHRFRLFRGLGGFTGQLTAIVELKTAPTAMIELAIAQDPLQQVQEAAVKAVDAIGSF